MSEDGGGISRRGLLGSIGALAAVSVAPAQVARPVTPPSFVDILRVPDSVTAYSGLKSARRLTRSGQEWVSGDISVGTPVGPAVMGVLIASPTADLTHLRLRWRGRFQGDLLVLGDQWERSYGDLEWRGLIPERVLPWYCAVHGPSGTDCYGVKTGARVLAFWQVDAEGISLWLDLRNGGEGVRLGGRVLNAVDVVCRRGHSGEDAVRAIHAFCGVMCAGMPTRPMLPLFGSNDWYYAYGKNTAVGIERDADLVAATAPAGGVRPFTIIDDGWRRPDAFPDMAGLAASIRRRGVRPGIWVRPLQASQEMDRKLLLPEARYGFRKERVQEQAFDPTIPEALELALAKVSEVVGWGYELVKHDFSTYELFGMWSHEMGASPTHAGWSFNDRTRTNAEIVNDLYRAIRRAAGEQVVIGCNTIGHLSAGIFEANRTGDDTSGTNWERTRLMSINTLAFRLPQNRQFFIVDADCVPITKKVDWHRTKMWLDLVARSGTALIVSAEPDAVGGEQRAALRDAFAAAAKPATLVSADDWLHNTSPEAWTFGEGVRKKVRYDWMAPDGASPFDLRGTSPVVFE